MLHTFTFNIYIKFYSKRNNSTTTNNYLNLENTKDKFISLQSSIKYIDKFNNFNYSGRRIIKKNTIRYKVFIYELIILTIEVM